MGHFWEGEAPAKPESKLGLNHGLASSESSFLS